jgi:hypothetical protein
MCYIYYLLLSSFRFLDIATACAFFNDMSMTLASDIAPNMVTVTPLPVGTILLAGVPFKDQS